MCLGFTHTNALFIANSTITTMHALDDHHPPPPLQFRFLELTTNTPPLHFTTLHIPPHRHRRHRRHPHITQYFTYNATSIGEVDIQNTVPLHVLYWNGTTSDYTLTKDDHMGPLGWYADGSIEQRELVNELQRMTVR
jgi:hypothetical protein